MKRFFISIFFGCCLLSIGARAEYIAGRNQATQKALTFITENGVYPLQLPDVFKRTLDSLKTPFPQLTAIEKASGQWDVQCQAVSASLNVSPDSSLTDLFTQIRPVLEACVTQEELKETLASSESYEYFMLEHFVGAYHPKARFYKPNPLDIYRDGATGAVGLVLKTGPQGLEIASTVAGSPAEAAGLKPGDRLLKIGSQEVANLKIEEAALKLRGVEGTKIDLILIPRGQSDAKQVSIQRQNMIVKSVHYDVIGTLGYLKIASFTPSTVSDFDQALAHFNEKAVTGLIMDLRNNDGGLIETAISIADRFLNGTLTIVSLTGQTPQTYKINPKTNQINWPMAVLVNKRTASAAEVLAGAFKDHKRAVLIGEKTAGKGSVRTVFTVNDHKMEIPVALAVTPKGRAIEATGIDPDKPVADATLTDSPAEVGDPVLQAAMQQMAPHNKSLGQLTAPVQPTPPTTGKSNSQPATPSASPAPSQPPTPIAPPQQAPANDPAPLQPATSPAPAPEPAPLNTNLNTSTHQAPAPTQTPPASAPAPTPVPPPATVPALQPR